MSDSVVDAGVIEKPPPSRAWRWIILAAIAIACYGGYYAFDYIGPLAPLLNRQLHFSNTDIGLLQAVYSLPNIVAMLVCWIADTLDSGSWLSFFQWTTIAYILSRGVAKASRVLEQ